MFFLAKIYVGQKFGSLTVEKMLDEKLGWYRMWLCKCQCGEKVKLTSRTLNRGFARSCGCEKIAGRDLRNKKFGKLTVMKKIGVECNYNLWSCRCECENEVSVSSHDLLSGEVLSCGCSGNGPIIKSHKRGRPRKTEEKQTELRPNSMLDSKLPPPYELEKYIQKLKRARALERVRDKANAKSL